MSETKNNEQGPDKREPTYTREEVVRLIVCAVVTPPTWGESISEFAAALVVKFDSERGRP
jgi:hypothetical protein